MPRQANPVTFQGPFTGVDERRSDRHLSPSELAACSNVVNRMGRICPRPGYEAVRDDTFGFVALTILSSVANLNGIAVDSTNEVIYYTTSTTVSKVNYDGSGQTDLVTGITSAQGIAVDVSGALVYWCENFGGSGKVRRCTTSGASATDIVTGLTSPKDVALDVSNSNLYYSDNTKLYREAITGGSQYEVYSAGSGSVAGISLDLTNFKIYWVNPSANTLHRSDLDGDNEETIYTNSTGSLYGVALNVATGDAYVTTTTTNTLQVVDISAGTSTTVYTGGTAMRHVDYDTVKKRVMWNDNGASKIQQSRNAVLGQYRIISSYWYERQVLGVDASGGDYVKDFVVLQLFDEANEQSDVAVWFPADDETVFLDMGYSTSGFVNTWVTNNRDSDPTAGDPFSVSAGRFSFDYTGQAVNTGKGGILMANGGEDDADNPYVLNYVLQPTIWRLTCSGISGNWTISFNGETTSNIATDTIAAEVRGYLLALDSIDGCWVTVDISGGTGDYVYDITVLGSWSGQDAPTMSATVGSGSITATKTQSGGLDTDATLYLRPAGLPRPIIDVSGAKTGTTGWYGEKSSTSENLTGVYNYRITYYSSLFDLESPPSDIFGNGTSTYADVSTDRFSIRMNYLPSTVWFNNPVFFAHSGTPSTTITSTTSVFTSDMVGKHIKFLRSGTNYQITAYINDTQVTVHANASGEDISGTNDCVIVNAGDAPYPIIDKVRVYRRKWGGTGTGDTATPDGVGAQSNWKYVSQFDLWHLGRYFDTGSVTDLGTGIDVPSVNEYPPSNAAFVKVIDGSAFYASTSAGDSNVWYSERGKQGGISNGELGFEYVSNESYVSVAKNMANDANFTGLASFGKDLIIGTPHHAIRGFVQSRDDGFIYVEPLKGTEGIASHWLIAETTHLDDSAAALYWMSPSGHVFIFDGINTQRVSRPLFDTASDTVKKFWIDTTYFETGTATLYYASMITDPVENRILVGVWDTSGNGRVHPYSLDMNAWTPGWTIEGWAWVVGREWTGTNKGKRIVCFGGDEGRFFKLSDGKADDGTSFSWSYKTARLSLGSMFQESEVWDMHAAFDIRDFGGTDAAAVITPYADGNAQTASTSATPQTGTDILGVKVTGRPRTLQMQVSGTQVDDQSHPEIIGYEFSQDGPRGLSRGVA